MYAVMLDSGPGLVASFVFMVLFLSSISHVAIPYRVGGALL